MGVLEGIGVIAPFPFYYWLWNHPQTWVDLCGKNNEPSKLMAYVSHLLKLIQFISLFSVSSISLQWPPLYFWPLFLAGQFLNFRYCFVPFFFGSLFIFSSFSSFPNSVSMLLTQPQTIVISYVTYTRIVCLFGYGYSSIRLDYFVKKSQVFNLR